jgi:hypothetical protein
LSVEGGGNVASQLEVLQVVLSNGNVSAPEGSQSSLIQYDGLVEQNVSRHEHGIRVEAETCNLVLRLGLEGQRVHDQKQTFH